MTSIVPNQGPEHTTFLVLDEVGHYGPVWREMSDSEANETTVVQWIIEGQFDRPMKIVAFNTDDGWSHDMTRNIATKLLDLNGDGVELSAAGREFVERITGRSATASV